MEESQEILLNSLASSGVPIPADVSSIQDLTPATLVPICAHSLRLILNTSSFPAALPESMADRFRTCTDLASAFKDLGYMGDISFHKFLYPSEEDMYKLVRFLVGRLLESSIAVKVAEEKDENARVAVVMEENIKSIRNELTKNVGNESGYGEEVVTSLEDLRLTTEVAEPRDCALGNEETVAQGDNNHVSENLSKTSYEIEKLQSQEKLLLTEVATKASELHHLEEEQELLKAAVEMAFDEVKSIDLYVTELNRQLDATRHNLVELDAKRDACIKPLEEKKRSLEESLCASKPEAREKLQKSKDIELETQSIFSETKKRDEQISKLSREHEKQSKLASRRSYIEKIKEITKNSRKQDIDIERILKETRDLQLESNSIQERLHRTCAVVDEAVSREAKKDPVGQQAYRLLTGIHKSFEQISEKVLATDRTRREVADFDAKLAAMASRGLNIDKLQADLDAIRKENEFLQSCGHSTRTCKQSNSV